MKKLRCVIDLLLLIAVVVLVGCSATLPRYVIDVNQLTYTDKATCDQLLKAMVPCQMVYEDRWEEGEGDVEDIINNVSHRVYELEIGLVDIFQWKPWVKVHFDDESVSQIIVHFAEYVPKKKALQRLGYDPNTLIKDPRTPDTWYAFLENVHRVHWQELDEGRVTMLNLDFW